MRRVDRMRDQAAVPARELLGETGWPRWSRSRTRGSRRARRAGRARAKISRLASTVSGVFSCTKPAPSSASARLAAVAHAGDRRLGVLDQAVRGKFAKPFGHQRAGLIGDARAGIVQRDLTAAARKHDRPGAADQSRSDDGDAFASHPQHLPPQREVVAAASARRRSRSPRRAPAPRCGRTSASARSR